MTTLEEVRDHAASGDLAPVFTNTAEFDRWLGEHDDEIKSTTLRSFADWLESPLCLNYKDAGSMFEHIVHLLRREADLAVGVWPAGRQSPDVRPTEGVER